jgi:hypothetical protein
MTEHHRISLAPDMPAGKPVILRDKELTNDTAPPQR